MCNDDPLLWFGGNYFANIFQKSFHFPFVVYKKRYHVIFLQICKANNTDLNCCQKGIICKTFISLKGLQCSVMAVRNNMFWNRHWFQVLLMKLAKSFMSRSLSLICIDQKAIWARQTRELLELSVVLHRFVKNGS